MLEWIEVILLFVGLFGGGGLIGVGLFVFVGRCCSSKKWNEIERNMK